ncbi:MAG: DMT family transporter [Candidatus Gastranaerophilales bacterium]|nr:DMT family transporter [Candidatus Gastranaerophilales bacterium]
MKDLLSKYKNQNEIFAYISLFIAVILYGTTLTATKVCLTFYSTPELMTFRMLISAFLFLPFFFTTYKNVKIEKLDLKFVLLMMICEPCLYFLFETNALKYTSSGQAGIVSALEPIFIVIGARIILKEKLPKIAYYGLFIAIIGSVFLSLASDVNEQAPNPIFGNFLELCAIILTDTSIITTKYLMDRYPPFYLAGISVMGGAVFFVLLNWIQGGSFAIIPNISAIIVLYLGILTVIAYALYNFSICTLSASKASPFLFLLPVAAVFFGWFFLGETFNLWQLAACSFIFGGIYISQLKDRKKIIKIGRFIQNRKKSIKK